ncbi:MAG TPA: hypothetical protein VF782_01410 [Allosphingosinicella sp.]|jgi:hypothetical protein
MVVRSALAVLALAMLVSGCNTMQGGLQSAPERVKLTYEKDGRTYFRDPAYDPSAAILNKEWDNSKSEDERRTARNDYVTAQMNLINRLFTDYEATFVTEAREGGFLGDFIVGALTIGASAIRDNEVVRFLTTAGATVQAGRSAVDKQILLDRTLSTLLNQMEAGRAGVKARIFERLRLPYADYPIGAAQMDVEDYYKAGTLVGALTAAADAATTSKIEEQERVDVALTGVFQTDLFTEALRTFIRDGGDAAGRTARRARAQRALDAQRIALGKRAGLPVVAFIESGSEADKKKLVQALHDDPEMEAEAKKKLADALAGNAPAVQTDEGTAPVTTDVANPGPTAGNTVFTDAFETDVATEALRTYLGTGGAAERKRRRELAQKLFDAQRIAIDKARMPVAAFVERGGSQDKDRLLRALWEAESGDAKTQLTQLLSGIGG